MRPKLREVEAHPIQHQGQAMLLLRDPLRLSDATIAIPRPLAPLLALMDGTRDEAGLEAALRVRAGVRLAPGLLPKFLADLDEALLLDNERFEMAREAARRAYREAPYRALTLGGSGFPIDPEAVAARLQSYLDDAPATSSLDGPRPVRGLVSPHIDYQRGGPVYAQVWRAAAEAARDAELAVIFGTDHQGSEGALTLTCQSYATPWGVLPTDTEMVGALAEVLSEAGAFGEELHHRGEHSIELAAIWLHFIRNRRPLSLVPILCGSFGAFVSGDGDPATHEPFVRALDVLKQVQSSRRTLVVAAADLAHMGPAFGDAYGLDFIAKAQLRNADERLLGTICQGDATAFFGMLRAEGDRRRVCGLPPIYLALRLLGEASGEPAGYAQCPADPQGLSFVTVAGVVLR